MPDAFIYATHRLDAGAERVDIQALRGHSTTNTTQIYSNVGQKGIEKVEGGRWFGQ